VLDASPVFFSVKEPVASSPRLTLIHFPSFFIQSGKQLDPTSTANRQENKCRFPLPPPHHTRPLA
jgi:hypothetical protein